MKNKDYEKNLAEFDQSTTYLLKTLPFFLKNYFDKLVEEGFSYEQSFELVKNYQNTLISTITGFKE